MPLILPDSTNLPTVVSDPADVSDDALRALSPDTIVHEIQRLQRSVEHLQSSNNQIDQFCNDPESSDLSAQDRQEFQNACEDNLGTISKQQGLIDRLVGVLSEKTGGPAAAAHYSVDATAQTGSTQDSAKQQTGATQAGTVDEANEGLFL
ncbi:hypothetical protein ACQY0O_005466 [Thecaphora frezii]